MGFYKTNLNKGWAQRRMSPRIVNSTAQVTGVDTGVIRREAGLIEFPLENRNDEGASGFTPAGESSLVLLRDYIESTAGRGRTVSGAVKTSLIARTEVLGVGWPLENPIDCTNAHVDPNEVPKGTPPTKLDTIKKLEDLALNVDATPFERAFADGALLMTVTSLRFSDAQRLRSLEMEDDAAYGTLLQPNTKRPHGLPWPWTCPLMGVIGSNQWALPIFELHRGHA